jgi:branched-chain amino acid transport system permease protein
MEETVRTVPAEVAAGAGPDLIPARQLSLRAAARVGALGGVAVAFAAATGMVVAFRDKPIVDSLTFDYILLLAILLGFGYLAGRPPPVLEGFEPSRRGLRNVTAGLVAGVMAGTVLVVFLAIFGNFNVRDVFINISPEMLRRLTFQQDLLPGSALTFLAAVGLMTLGATLNLLGDRWRNAFASGAAWVVVFGLLESLIRPILDRLGFPLLGQMYGLFGALTIPGAIGVFAVFFALSAIPKRTRRQLRQSFEALPTQQRRMVGAVSLLVILGLLVVLPQILGTFLSEVLNIAGIFLLMALGLNIVVGFAGLLDLGYVAFFAVGAYTTAVLTWQPIGGARLTGSIELAPEITFWVAIFFVVLAAAASGLIVGTPVLRMRGDYLAIVTLGFGEIARILFLSTWLKPYFGGALGIQRIPNVHIFGIELLGTQAFFYLIFGFAVAFVYVAYALQNSRIGRAWTAMREDENVAEAMGVNIVSAKLWAFIIGAILASFGGALFAVKIGSVFPHSFSVTVSITILIIVIVGGLGSIPGVALAALVLVGLPELLQEFQEFRFLIYGMLLIYMMQKRPEGFIPSKRRARELHEDETLQDEWLRARAREQAAQPVAGT